MTPLEQRSLQVAKRYLGTKEATGKNDGPVVRMFQRFIAKGAAWLDNQPWCVCFALFCVKTAANELGATSTLPLLSSTSQLYRWYQAKGLLLTAPQAGCVGMMKGGATGHHHTFLVHDIQGDRVLGVDGNWGNAVAWTHHLIGECDFGMIV